ncbi:uncharacterized protein RAG0_01759 [Rhynchosporium agropyri]|uniref:Uncharacterized protein n=1 Tax=Rhynchosporium agropyri TaxID=914238 RepID=A0A1E1JZ01_9HELO|nr:uncharacterized protein RAG0_01759 [Rhynchosporium agropyri]
MSVQAEPVRRRSRVLESQSPRTSVHSDSLRRRSRIIESRSPRGHYTTYLESEDDDAIEVLQIKERSEWEDLKIRALHFLEDVLPQLRIPFAIIASSLLVYWAITSFSTAAGPAICDFPGAEKLEVCQTNSSELAVHIVDPDPGFDFAPKYAEMQKLAAGLSDVPYRIKGQYVRFNGAITDLTNYEDTVIAMEPVHTATRSAVKTAANSVHTWLNKLGTNLDRTLVHYTHARNELQDLKTTGPISKLNSHVKPGSDTEKYNTTLSHLHEALSPIQEGILAYTTTTLQALVAVEDNIDITLQAATRNTKVLKREKLGEARYWAWRLRSLKERYLKTTHLAQKPALLSWDAHMLSCAEFSGAVRRARAVIESSFLLMLDTKRTLDRLERELGRGEIINVWAAGGDGGEGNLVEMYLGTLNDGLRVLKRARDEARLSGREASQANWDYLESL